MIKAFRRNPFKPKRDPVTNDLVTLVVTVGLSGTWAILVVRWAEAVFR